MKWSCKVCRYNATTRGDLLQHYRLQHWPSGTSVACLHLDCPCSFKTWTALRTHLSRYHTQDEDRKPEVILSLKCVLCSSIYTNEKEYFQHLGNHLKSHETTECVFIGCAFKTNIYGTFFTHKSRKHNPHSLEDFKPDVIGKHQTLPNETDLIVSDQTCEDTGPNQSTESSKEIIRTIGSLLLKLESVYNVSSKCIDELVEELNFICTASAPVIQQVVHRSLEKYSCAVEEDVVTELVEELCKSHPLSSALGVNGPFGSSFKRKKYLKEHFDIVEPVEYILNSHEKLSFQYVPLLQTLQHILAKKYLADAVLKILPCTSTQYESYQNGTHFKNNEFFSEEPRISLILYIDDFEVCNPLGTSRKKHKITGVYWALANAPPEVRSTLTAIHLSILCKAVDVKRFGYEAILEPLLKELSVLEQEGVFVPKHRQRLQEVFPNLKLTPKHHYLEHYPALIEAFGPLVNVWTMRFEAKHRFFKRVVRFTGNFKNVLLSLSTKHQMMMAYHWQRNTSMSALSVSKVSSVPLEVLDGRIQESVKELFLN
ncbi:uncharacterized protein LOC131543945 [Onychostoma macrolepis]|uniref:uncharacterized protein LOC131543945 n=1 Tax=Onychostoma macrolepis TaxID=369639 RepID=UPI00272D3538|nr:uncharacterized protein LOC131543945 [Onychostoma macrolepis]